jgi:hypothetical protein
LADIVQKLIAAAQPDNPVFPGLDGIGDYFNSFPRVLFF